MNRCASVRKHGSTEQCSAKPLVGHTLCGKHARMKTPILWVSVHQKVNHPIIKAQALIRGWLLRTRLALAGPGVLCRKNLANDEELITCETNLHPLEYFGFEESGKIWWFSFDSLWKWSIRSHEPVNPYTKVRLSADTCRRLRQLWAYNQRHSIPLPEESNVYEERLQCRWNFLCQVFQSNGFVDVHPQMFMEFSKADYLSMFVLLYQDLRIILQENDPYREKILRFCRLGMSTREALITTRSYTLQCVYIIMLLISFHKDPYSMVFSVLSALYRC
jgi:hypothetical protein